MSQKIICFYKDGLVNFETAAGVYNNLTGLSYIVKFQLAFFSLNITFNQGVNNTSLRRAASKKKFSDFGFVKLKIGKVPLCYSFSYFNSEISPWASPLKY
jgi:hypothetical protein